MRDKRPTLRLSVNTTVAFLLCSGTLLVFGIFDEALGWDIFSPKVEKVLIAIFQSSICLSLVGVAITLVLSSHESVRYFSLIQEKIAPIEEPDTPKSTSRIYRRFFILSTCLALSLVLLGVANNHIENHRIRVFHTIAGEQAEFFSDRMKSEILKLKEIPRDNIPHRIHDVLTALDQFSFINRSTLYLPDPVEASALWGMTAWRSYDKKDGFARFYVARHFEKELRNAFLGDKKALDRLNALDKFEHYLGILKKDGSLLAILRIDGNPFENFRNYDEVN